VCKQDFQFSHSAQLVCLAESDCARVPRVINGGEIHQVPWLLPGNGGKKSLAPRWLTWLTILITHVASCSSEKLIKTPHGWVSPEFARDGDSSV